MNKPQIDNKKISSLKETLVYLDYQLPGITDYLYSWFDGDVNELECLPLPPEDNECTCSWGYLKGVRVLILKEIPEFEKIVWTDINIYNSEFSLCKRYEKNYKKTVNQVYI